jgi:hypothetical protein
MSTNPEEYHAGGEEESAETGTAYNPTTGEPETTPHDVELAQEEAESGNPNAATSAGLEGDMGISSERTGPADETGTAGLGDLDRFATRSVGTAKGRTHGSTPTATSAAPEGPEMDEEQNPAEVPSHQLSNKNPGHSGGTPGQSSE